MSEIEKWIQDLHLTRLTLTRLRCNIGGQTPAETLMCERLRLAGEIVEAVETIETQNRIAGRTK